MNRRRWTPKIIKLMKEIEQISFLNRYQHPYYSLVWKLGAHHNIYLQIGTQNASLNWIQDRDPQLDSSKEKDLTFEEVLNLVSPEIRTELLFHLDLFR